MREWRKGNSDMRENEKMIEADEKLRCKEEDLGLV